MPKQSETVPRGERDGGGGRQWQLMYGFTRPTCNRLFARNGERATLLQSPSGVWHVASGKWRFLSAFFLRFPTVQRVTAIYLGNSLMKRALWH